MWRTVSFCLILSVCVLYSLRWRVQRRPDTWNESVVPRGVNVFSFWKLSFRYENDDKKRKQNDLFLKKFVFIKLAVSLMRREETALKGIGTYHWAVLKEIPRCFSSPTTFYLHIRRHETIVLKTIGKRNKKRPFNDRFQKRLTNWYHGCNARKVNCRCVYSAYILGGICKQE